MWAGISNKKVMKANYIMLQVLQQRIFNKNVCQRN